MKLIPTELPGVTLIEPNLYHDDRGYFLESWHEARYRAEGLPGGFVQDNLSFSKPGVLRGLHLQWPKGQAKLVWVLSGSIFDVAVDVRVGSPTFGKWAGAELSDRGHRQLFIPAGFAHGFVVTSDAGATVGYKVDAPYAPADELTIAWDDPEIAIDWPVRSPVLSAKDRQGLRLRDTPPERLPAYRSGL